MTKDKKLLKVSIVFLYAIFIGYSLVSGFTPGICIGENFLNFFLQMLKLLPCVFILIGLFEVWVKRETVERHLGRESGFLSYLWGILLAGTTVGGLYVALPIAVALHAKGARMGVVFAYLSASAICRVPMTMFEAGFLGWRFSLVRLAVSLPLIIVSSIILGKYFERKNYVMPGGE